MKLKSMLWNLIEKLRPEEKQNSSLGDYDLASLESQLDELHNRCNSLEAQLIDLGADIDSVRDEAENAYNEAQDVRTEVENDIDDLKSTVQTLENDLTDAILTDSLNGIEL